MVLMAQPLYLYDAKGRPIRSFRRTKAAAFDAGGSGRRALGWNPTRADLNAVVASGEIDTVRARTRDMLRKSSWADGAVESFVTNAIGNGIVPKPQTKDRTLRDKILEEWTWFTEESDADGQLDFYGQQALAVRSIREGGECFIRHRFRRPSDRLRIPYQIQLLEAEMCDAQKNSTDNRRGYTINGIEFDPTGRRRAYWIFPMHPGGPVGGYNTAASRRVRSDRISHVFQPSRPGQVRGIPPLAVALAKLYDLDQYEDAELIRKKLAAAISGYETTPEQDASVFDEGDVDSDDVPIAGIEAGAYWRLPPGHDVKFNEPAEVGNTFEPFVRYMLREVAMAAGVMYEQMTGDLTQVNFSSIRAGLVEFRRKMEQFQRHIVVVQFCRPIWKMFLETSVLADRLPAEALEVRAQWCVTPGWGWVDPEKEIKAEILAMEANVESRSNVIMRRGEDPQELDEEMRDDQERAEEFGLSASASEMEEETGQPEVQEDQQRQQEG
jgi:lambda family phage portal protein